MIISLYVYTAVTLENAPPHSGSSDAKPIVSACFWCGYPPKAGDTGGKYSTPLLWDKEQNTIVNNESMDILRRLLPILSFWGCLGSCKVWMQIGWIRCLSCVVFARQIGWSAGSYKECSTASSTSGPRILIWTCSQALLKLTLKRPIPGSIRTSTMGFTGVDLVL